MADLTLDAHREIADHIAVAKEHLQAAVLLVSSRAGPSSKLATLAHQAMAALGKLRSKLDDDFCGQHPVDPAVPEEGFIYYTPERYADAIERLEIGHARKN